MITDNSNDKYFSQKHLDKRNANSLFGIPNDKNYDEDFKPVPDALRKNAEGLAKIAQGLGIDHKGFHPNALMKNYRDLGNNKHHFILDWNGKGEHAGRYLYNGNYGSLIDLDNPHSLKSNFKLKSGKNLARQFKHNEDNDSYDGNFDFYLDNDSEGNSTSPIYFYYSPEELKDIKRKDPVKFEKIQKIGAEGSEMSDDEYNELLERYANGEFTNW